ncbi:hypothetical protein GCM10007423_23710 [Dyadobacter endophyticus]|uniref:Uncharacterized protein n=1 Tax=Dyadobacter endophyticus TaxID=1749036 RepID=A0ABQ1YQS9_9BACT|nr:hypothetical protein GCM10007423_23710 [Dyadobacter endophyticus]
MVTSWPYDNPVDRDIDFDRLRRKLLKGNIKFEERHQANFFSIKNLDLSSKCNALFKKHVVQANTLNL